MNIEERLVETRAKLQDILKQVNTLEEQKQQLLQEVLRTDGQIALLLELQREQKEATT